MQWAYPGGLALVKHACPPSASPMSYLHHTVIVWNSFVWKPDHLEKGGVLTNAIKKEIFAIALDAMDEKNQSTSTFQTP